MPLPRTRESLLPAGFVPTRARVTMDSTNRPARRPTVTRYRVTLWVLLARLPPALRLRSHRAERRAEELARSRILPTRTTSNSSRPPSRPPTGRWAATPVDLVQRREWRTRQREIDPRLPSGGRRLPGTARRPTRRAGAKSLTASRSARPRTVAGDSPPAEPKAKSRPRACGGPVGFSGQAPGQFLGRAAVRRLPGHAIPGRIPRGRQLPAAHDVPAEGPRSQGHECRRRRRLAAGVVRHAGHAAQRQEQHDHLHHQGRQHACGWSMPRATSSRAKLNYDLKRDRSYAPIEAPKALDRRLDLAASVVLRNSSTLYIDSRGRARSSRLCRIEGGRQLRCVRYAILAPPIDSSDPAARSTCR